MQWDLPDRSGILQVTPWFYCWRVTQKISKCARPKCSGDTKNCFAQKLYTVEMSSLKVNLKGSFYAPNHVFNFCNKPLITQLGLQLSHLSLTGRDGLCRTDISTVCKRDSKMAFFLPKTLESHFMRSFLLGREKKNG